MKSSVVCVLLLAVTVVAGCAKKSGPADPGVASAPVMGTMAAQVKGQKVSGDMATGTAGSHASAAGTKKGAEAPMVVPVANTRRCRADKNMLYPKVVPTPGLLACETDGDCIVTGKRNGNCCDHGCNQRWVYTRTLFEAIRARQKECCDGIKLTCDIWRCPRNRLEHNGKCVKGRCTMVSRPAAWTLMKAGN